ncbi:MAG: DUF4199 domain-containing protein, partial [Bacteroidota bacterium]|nr:DUF4199 domain-containing protein [Bacteroidota bacterium]
IIAGIIYGTKNYRDNFQNGIITYARALGTGTLIVLFAGVFQGLYTYVFVTFVDTEYFDKIVEQTIIASQERGLSDDQIEATLKMSNMMRTPIILSISTILGSAFMGFIFSLITSIFLKKEGDGFEQAMSEINENK